MEVPTWKLSFQTGTRWLPVIRFLVAFMFLCVAASAGDERALRPKKESAADAGSGNSGMRLYHCLLVRRSQTGEEVGLESLDPLFWANTKYLVTGESHKRALACLDDFLSSHGERTIENPIQSAMLQRDLWALFDWSARDVEPKRELRELQSRLAEVLRRLALSENISMRYPILMRKPCGPRNTRTNTIPQTRRLRFFPQISSSQQVRGFVSAPSRQ